MISIENQFEIIGLHFTIFIATFKIYYFLKHFFVHASPPALPHFKHSAVSRDHRLLPWKESTSRK